MRRAIDRVGPCRLSITNEVPPFESLLRAIVYQSVSTRVAESIHGRVLQTISRSGEYTEDRVIRTPDQRLRNAGLSWAKVAAIKDLARKSREGVVPDLDGCRALSDEQLIEQIASVRGIGKWTVEMLLIFRLGRPDVLPVDDLAIQKGFMLALDLDAKPKPREINEYGERWRPFRSVASWYLWRLQEL